MNKPILHTGYNYLLIQSFEESVEISRSSINPEFALYPESFPPLPRLSAGIIVIPLFAYDFYIANYHYRMQPIYRKEYLRKQDNSVYSDNTGFGDNSFIVEKSQMIPVKGRHYNGSGNASALFKRDDLFTRVSGPVSDGMQLHPRETDLFSAADFLFIRDIINPDATEQSVLEKIDTLHISTKEKLFLNKLLKIMYAGTFSDERKLVSAIFSAEPEFGYSLQKSLFSINILPLIHGPFLYNILNKIEDQTIRNGIDLLNADIKKIVLANLSNNRRNYILSLPVSKKGADEFIRIIEDEIRQQFARKIYFKSVKYEIFCINPDGKQVTFHPVNSDKINFTTSTLVIDFIMLTEKSLIFAIKEPVSYLRIDTFYGNRYWKTFIFHDLPGNSYLPVAFIPFARFSVGAGFTSVNEHFELMIDYYDY